MTFDQILNGGPSFPRFKPTDDYGKVAYKSAQSAIRWFHLPEKKAARRSAIKARWNRYRRLCGLPLSNK